MKIEELLQKYPTRRIKPVNGMAVTAEVWEEAHEYHRQSQGLQTVFSRGAGILAGLEVIAGDPPAVDRAATQARKTESGSET